MKNNILKNVQAKMKRGIIMLPFFLLAVLLITCRDVDSTFPNQPPIANAGQNVSLLAGQPASLDGSASSDPDKVDILSYTWTFISKPVGSKATINNFDVAKASFTPDQAGLYSVRLVVSDNVASDADTLHVTVTNSNGTPLINAGKDTQVDLGTQYAFSATATDPNGDALTIQWSLQGKPIGSNASIQNPTSLTAILVGIDKHGIYTAHLQVSDGTLTAAANVSITTNPVGVTSINPTSGPFGTTVKIAGKNFSTTLSENTVTFNGATATVTSANYTSLVAVVPVTAGTGLVAVTVNGIQAIGPVFTYILTPTASTASQFNSPFDMAADGNGNLYISDYNTHVIRKLTSTGQLSIVAGSGVAGYTNAKLVDSQFNHPSGIAIAADNSIYVADNGNHCIRKISLSSGIVSTVAGFPQAGYVDGKVSIAQFNSPIGLAIDAVGNLYVGDNGNNRVRKISTSAVVSTIAANSAALNGVAGIDIDAANTIYVAEVFGNRIKKINAQEVVTTLVGSGTAGFVNGTGATARFNLPYGVACDAAGNVYIADYNNHSIRKVTPQGVVSTLIGNGSAGFVDGVAAQFNQPTGLTVMPNGSIYIADFSNQRVRLITFQ